MNARRRALIRDLVARARLAEDPIAQIKMRPGRREPIYRMTARGVDLTPRELQVLECLSRGLEYPMVGDALGISLESVKSHAKHARFKLRAKNSIQACCEALRLGLIR